MEIEIATLATDRASLLYGVPATAKSWESEHLTAALTRDSTLLIQGVVDGIWQVLDKGSHSLESH